MISSGRRRRGWKGRWVSITPGSCGGKSVKSTRKAEAVCGDVTAVGAPYADVGGKADQGAVYVFGRNTGGANNWSFVKKLAASDGTTNDYFGFGALSGDLLVVKGSVLTIDNGS